MFSRFRPLMVCSWLSLSFVDAAMTLAHLEQIGLSSSMGFWRLRALRPCSAEPGSFAIIEGSLRQNSYGRSRVFFLLFFFF